MFEGETTQQLTLVANRSSQFHDANGENHVLKFDQSQQKLEMATSIRRKLPLCQGHKI